MTDLVDLIWPQPAAPNLPPDELPTPPAGSSIPAIVHAEARAAFDRQDATWRSVDDKASTVIAAALVVVGLTLPNLVLGSDVEKWLFFGLAVVVGYGLLSAIGAYMVQRVAVGMTPRSGMDALAHWTNAEAALAAVTAILLRAHAENKPALECKARPVQRSLLSLAIAALLLAALFVAGAFYA